MNYKAAIFDFDGTLVDSMPMWESLALNWAEKHHIPITQELYDLAKYGDMREAANYIATHYPRININRTMVTWGLGALLRYATTVPLKSGVREFLEKLRAEGIPMAIATSCPKKLCHLGLRRHGLHSMFQSFSFSGDLPYGKDHPDVFLDAARQLGVKPEDCMVFEDSYIALTGAHAAGMRLTAVYDSASAYTDQLKKEADCYVDSFDELL